MLNCLFIAGTLYGIGVNQVAVPIGPNTVAVDYETTVAISHPQGQTQLQKTHGESLAELLLACENVAVEQVEQFLND